MKLGISTASFFNRMQTEATFDVLRQLRVDTTEVFLNTYSEYEKPFIDGLVPRKGAINVHSVHSLGLQYEPQLFNSNARVRTDAENLFRKVCYAGFMLGAKYYTFHGPVMLKKREYSFDYVKLGDRVNQLIEIAQSYGIRLSYENVHWTYAYKPDFFKQILKQCPLLSATLDVKQALQAKTDPFKFLDIMGDRISTFHFCDVDREGNTVLPGKGKFKFEKFFREVKKYKIHAHGFMEVYSRDYKDIVELKESYDYLNEINIKSKS